MGIGLYHRPNRWSAADSDNLDCAPGGVAPEGTPGTVVAVLGDGEASLVEYLGEWGTPNAQGTSRGACHAT